MSERKVMRALAGDQKQGLTWTELMRGEEDGGAGLSRRTLQKTLGNLQREKKISRHISRDGTTHYRALVFRDKAFLSALEVVTQYEEEVRKLLNDVPDPGSITTEDFILRELRIMAVKLVLSVKHTLIHPEMEKELAAWAARHVFADLSTLRARVMNESDVVQVIDNVTGSLVDELRTSP